MMIAPVAMADTISSGDYVKLIDYNLADNAGIMTYAVSHNGGANTAFTYDTFCIQDNVYIYPNTWYPVASVSNQVGLKDSPLPSGTGQLNGAVDYLFYRFKSGAYDKIMTSDATENDFQRVLWSLQGSGSSYSYANGYLWDSDLDTYNNTLWMQQKSWGTKVINIASSMDGTGSFSGPDIQNQLYNQVPEPSSLLLLGFGVSALVLARRGK